MTKQYDVIVIGGGAAGLFYTTVAANKHNNISFAIIEKNQRVGKKLALTGNGRCNLTNINCSAENYHGSFKPYCNKLLSICPADKVLEIFNNFGLITRVDEVGRVYPKSNQATTVLDVLRFNCDRANVDIICEETVLKVKKQGDKFRVTADSKEYICSKLIVATGGAASPKAGGDKSGYEILRGLGHKINKLSPALCPVKVKSEHIKSLKGLRVQGNVQLISDSNCVKEESGEIQFADNALSGICVFNLSQYIENNKKYILKVRLLPEFEFEQVYNMLKNNRARLASLDSENIMTGMFHKRIAQIIMKEAGVGFGKKVMDISNLELSTLADTINNLNFAVDTVSDYNLAQVTKGGVSGDEINPDTMESNITKGLYILGEAIDLNGDCGGYNLQFAFATAYIASNAL